MLFRTFLFALALVLVTSHTVLAQGFFDRIKKAVTSKDSQDVTSEILSSPTGLTKDEISNGLREALNVSMERVVNQLGQSGGFLNDQDIRIPLPGSLNQLDRVLGRFGMSALTDELEVRLNSAAEIATPKAKKLFVEAISDMTIEDAHGILTGPEDAATSYLRSKMGPQLEKEMRPIVRRALGQSGAIKAYKNAVKNYDQIPYMPDVEADLQGYVVERALSGIFYYVAQEEAAIRSNPVERSTDLLKKVFAAQ